MSETPVAFGVNKVLGFTRIDGTRFVVRAAKVEEVSENPDGTVTVVMHSPEYAGSPVRVCVRGPFDTVMDAIKDEI